MTTLPKPTDPAVLAILLDALSDQQPAPKPPRWELEGTRGFARSWCICPKCKGSGQATWKGRTVLCDRAHCHGNGGWPGDPMQTSLAAGPVQVNGAKSQSVREFYDLAVSMSLPELERLDTAIDRLTMPGDLERQARAQHPCWQQLTNALHGLEQAAPSHNRALHWTHIDHLPLGPALLAVYDDALLILGDVLGPRFRAPHWALVKAAETLRDERARKANGAGRHALSPWQRDQRDDRIRDLAARGDKPTAIGRKVGLDRKTVERILAKHREAA